MATDVRSANSMRICFEASFFFAASVVRSRRGLCLGMDPGTTACSVTQA